MKVNEKIRFLRESKDWTQEEMADKLGMSTYGYSKIELGKVRVNMQKLDQISEVLGLELLELLAVGEKGVVVGEKNIVFFKDADHSFNIIGSSQEIQSELAQLKLELRHKDEMIHFKDQLIESQNREINNLQLLLENAKTLK